MTMRPSLRRNLPVIFGVLFCAWVLALTLYPSVAQAKMQANMDCKSQGEGGLVAAIVPCVMNIIEESGVSLAQSFLTLFRPVFYAFLTLVITFFGVKVLQGGGDVSKESLVLLIKVAFVVGLLEMSPNFIPIAKNSLENIISVVSGALASSSSTHCDSGGASGSGAAVLWAQMDCILGKLFGFSGNSASSKVALSASAFGALTGFLFSGATGSFVFMAIISVLISVFMMIARTVAAYINGFIMVCLLLIVTPAFLPLVLLQVTTEYFDKWWRAILASMLMPLIVSAYFAIAMIVYDDLLFKPDSLVQKLFDPGYMKQTRVENNEYCPSAMVQDQEFSKKGSGMEDAKRLKEPGVQNKVQPLLSGNNLACISGPGMRMKPQDMQKLFVQLLQLMIAAFVLQKGFQQLRTLVGNFGSGAVAATMDPVSDQEKKLSAAIEAGQSGAMKAAVGKGKTFEQSSGSDFIRTMPGAMSGAVREFMRTLGR